MKIPLILLTVTLCVTLSTGCRHARPVTLPQIPSVDYDCPRNGVYTEEDYPCIERTVHISGLILKGWTPSTSTKPTPPA